MHDRAIIVRDTGIAVEPIGAGDFAAGGALHDPTLDDAALVAIAASGINYKDALALAGRPGIIRGTPRVPGIDLVGTIAEAPPSGRWKVGDRVLATGWGLGEAHNGGLATIARVSSAWLTASPESFTDHQLAAIGTAGLTAALCVDQLAAHAPLDGARVAVTGAAGGVGSIAIALLAAAGAHVTAVSGRSAETARLFALGAHDVVGRDTFGGEGKPLQKATFDAAVDVVGGDTLANLIARIDYRGAVAACGLAGGTSLPTTVLPFILRGVTLYGIDSVQCPTEVRARAWDRLARDLDAAVLGPLGDVAPGSIRTVSLDDAIDVALPLLDGNIRGRRVIDVRA